MLGFSSCLDVPVMLPTLAFQFRFFTTSAVPNILIAVPSKKEKLPLSVTHPDLAKEADGWDTATVTYGSSKRAKWKCALGHKWEAKIDNRTIHQSRCPYCANRKVWPGFNDLLTKNPKIANEADGWDPKTVTSGSNLQKNWICSLGHKWRVNINSRTSQNSGCPTCSNKRVETGFNDLATSRPEIALMAYKWDPKSVTEKSGSSKKWLCKEGHIFKAKVADMSNGRGCAVCGGRQIEVGSNDLATTHPAIALEADGWDPRTVGRGHRKRLQWRCFQGHSWLAQPNDRTGKDSGCPFCTNRKLLIGFNDLSTTHPSFAIEAFEWNPTEITSAFSKNLSWKCQYGHIWESSPLSRTHQNTGCLVCLGKQILSGFNDLQTTHPQLAKEADGWDPSTIIAGSNKLQWWICSEKHRWRAQPNSRTGGAKTGCPTCSNSGFNPNDRGYLYFLNHQKWEMFQIGITNNPDKRLGQHKKLGWEIIELRGPMDGHLTQQWETSILRMLKAKGADLSNDKIAGKFDGYSEAWSKSTFEVKSIKELMRLTEEFEGNV